MRLPDWLYGALERVYFAQRAIRREEGQRALEAEDRALRDYYNDLRQRHAAGTCGGVTAGCCYVPCRCPVDCTVHRAHDRNGAPIVPTHLSSPTVGGKLD